MHIIPADVQIEKTLKAIRTGQVVKLSGYLIEAKAANGWHWKSAITRIDTGAGAFEVVQVKNSHLSNHLKLKLLTELFINCSVNSIQVAYNLHITCRFKVSLPNKQHCEQISS